MPKHFNSLNPTLKLIPGHSSFWWNYRVDVLSEFISGLTAALINLNGYTQLSDVAGFKAVVDELPSLAEEKIWFESETDDDIKKPNEKAPQRGAMNRG